MNSEEARTLLTRIDERVGTLVQRSDDQEKRLRVLEQARWRMAGAVTAISIGVGYFAKKLGIG